jgi:hypothetical protein
VSSETARDEPNDLGQLSERFPGWYLSAAWSGSASGPGVSKYTAKREGVTLTAFSVAALAREIERQEARQ